MIVDISKKMESKLLEKALQLCYAHYVERGNTQEEAEKIFKGLTAIEVYRICGQICMEQASKKT